MDRRRFLRTGTAALAGACWSARLTAKQPASPTGMGRFRLKYAPHFGMFKHSAGDDLIDQLKFAADRGFTAWEDGRLKDRPVAVQDAVARTMNSLGMEMGAFVATTAFPDVSLVRSRGPAWDRVLEEVRGSVEVAKRVNARWVTVALGRCEAGVEPGDLAKNCVELLKRCCQVLEPHGLVMVLELSNRSAQHARPLNGKVPDANWICRAVGSPSCRLLFDAYQQHTTEGNLISSVQAAWTQIAYVRCGDNPGRKEPGTGEIDYRKLFAHLHANRYAGIVGMHHGNSKPGTEGERAVIKAYVAAERA